MGSSMQLRDGLKQRRGAIIDRWKSLALSVYPERAACFIQRERDRFQNPVGYVMGRSLGTLFDALLTDLPAEELRGALDGIVRIRAVQDLSPSQALGFLFLLKRAIRDVLGSVGDEDMPMIAERIDRIALEAFDVYSRCREQIYDLRLREIRGRTSTCFERYAGRAPESPKETRG